QDIVRKLGFGADESGLTAKNSKIRETAERKKAEAEEMMALLYFYGEKGGGPEGRLSSEKLAEAAKALDQAAGDLIKNSGLQDPVLAVGLRTALFKKAL